MSWVLSVIMIGDTLAVLFSSAGVSAGKGYAGTQPCKNGRGACGYLVGGMSAGIIGRMFFLQSLGWIETLALALALSILGQIGDLFESWIKRIFAVKDSGHWLPGHGGMLDRLDSLIFPAVFTTAYLRVFHA